jgi:hypothetical protein
VVYLMGCDHQTAQTYPIATSLVSSENATRFQFKILILDLLKKHAITAVAEENSAELLRRSGRRSVPFEAAQQANACHIYCDPTPDEREKLHIEEDLPFFGPSAPAEWQTRIRSVDESYLHDIAHRWPIREDFWLDQLTEHLQEAVLFVCGDAHRCTFRRRLEKRGIEVKIVAKRYGAAPLSKRYFTAYKRVRRDGFPPKNGCFCVSPIGGVTVP